MVEVGAIAGAGIGERYKIGAKRVEGGTLLFLSAAREFPVTGGGNVEHIIKALCNNCFILHFRKNELLQCGKNVAENKNHVSGACHRRRTGSCTGNGRWVRRNIPSCMLLALKLQKITME